ncbi:cation transporter, partial [Simkania negevensis]|nr:cation transporter [Simkania negevensis]
AFLLFIGDVDVASIKRMRFPFVADAASTALIWSIACSFVFLIAKAFVFFLSDSVAIFSDLMESAIHFIVNGIVVFSLWYSRQPADKEHPYGHGKIVYFSSASEGLLILFAGIMIAFYAINAFFHRGEVHHINIALVFEAGVAIVNCILGLYLIRTGKRCNTFVLVSNGKHFLVDMWTSLGVVVGVSLVKITGLVWFDPAVALLISVHIVFSAWSLLRRSYQGLMEKVDAKERDQIVKVLQEACRNGTIVNYHELRHRHVNDKIWIELHLLFPETMSICEAHARACLVEISLERLFLKDKVWITTHLEPRGHAQAHPKEHPEHATVVTMQGEE